MAGSWRRLARIVRRRAACGQDYLVATGSRATSLCWFVGSNSKLKGAGWQGWRLASVEVLGAQPSPSSEPVAPFEPRRRRLLDRDRRRPRSLGKTKAPADICIVKASHVHVTEKFSTLSPSHSSHWLHGELGILALESHDLARELPACSPCPF